MVVTTPGYCQGEHREIFFLFKGASFSWSQKQLLIQIKIRCLITSVQMPRSATINTAHSPCVAHREMRVVFFVEYTENVEGPPIR